MQLHQTKSYFLSCHLQPDTITGDVVFVLQLKKHSKFERKMDDLFVEHSLSLTEALCGYQFALTHLDGRQLLIKSNPCEIVKPGITCKLFSLNIILSSSLITRIFSGFRSIQSN